MHEFGAAACALYQNPPPPWAKGKSWRAIGEEAACFEDFENETNASIVHAEPPNHSAMKNYQFQIIITQDEDGLYVARVPELAGCHTQAKDLPTLNKRINEAIELCLEVQRQKRQTIPQSKFIALQQIQMSF